MTSRPKGQPAVKGRSPELPPGLIHTPRWSGAEQAAAMAAIRDGLDRAPFYRPAMPRTGKPFSVQMSNFGQLGWVSDREGYRYQARHPVTGNPWPPIPPIIMALWEEFAAECAPAEACLVNYYAPGARMGLHQDRDEDDFSAPVVSVSLGDDCRFRVGGTSRGGPTTSVRLVSGDVVVLGGAARLCYHGVDRIFAGTSELLAGWLSGGGRINLTLRRVTRP